MKKNNMLRLASVLLVAVLLSTCAISGVFANYQTKGSTNDTARVAKWGVTIAATTDAIGNVMFSDSYKDEGTVYNAAEKGADITVQADTKDTNVVAPGTNGTLAKFDIAGKPEVDVKVTYTAAVDLKNWEVVMNEETGEKTKCPIVITVNTVEYYVGGQDKSGATIDDAAELATAVKAAIEAVTNDYDANTDLSEAAGAVNVGNDLVVTWKWANSTADADIANDTALGNAAANATVDAPAASIALTVGVSIDQIN